MIKKIKLFDQKSICTDPGFIFDGNICFSELGSGR